MDAKRRIMYVSGGNLISDDKFLHPRRNIDTYVLLMCRRGVLHIFSNGKYYDLKENEYLILLPYTLHFGFKPSEGPLSYYWSHFNFCEPEPSVVVNETEVAPILGRKAIGDGETYPNQILLPEYGKISDNKKAFNYFSQLLDVSKRSNGYVSAICHYSLKILLIQLTQDFLAGYYSTISEYPVLVTDLMEWVRDHIDSPLLVKTIAEHFNYHPTYISTMFKKYTGEALNEYIQSLKINTAKSLLENHNLSITEISQMVGYKDPKYFMKLFKRMEGVSPSRYRESFHEKKVNH